MESCRPPLTCFQICTPRFLAGLAKCKSWRCTRAFRQVRSPAAKNHRELPDVRMIFRMRMIFRLPCAGAALLATLLTSGCVDLAPGYQRPAAPIPASWPVATPAVGTGASDPGDIGWRQFLLDERLQRVVELALANNRDLRIAALDVESARARFRVQDAAKVPGVAANAGVTRARASGHTASSDTLGVALTGYELDLFGRLKNLSAEALQNYLSTAEGARTARISLVSEVATAWVTLAADAEKTRLIERTVALESRSLDLTRRRHELGAIKGLPVVQAQANVESARGALAATRVQLLLDRQALTLLTGSEIPEGLLPVKAWPAQVAVLVDLPSGLPARVLLQRPDVLGAEHELRAAQFDIGVARAAFFPVVTLTGSAGTASAGLSSLFQGGMGSWGFGPTVSLPIFDGGAHQAGLDLSKAQREAALAGYEKTVQTAFREVADALGVRSTIAEQIAAQQAQTQAYETALRYAEALFLNGASSYLEVLDAQRSLFLSQQAEISLKLQEQDNRIALYKALGGGWKEFE
jgi:outer membrane protein, multidrug efflux system